LATPVRAWKEGDRALRHVEHLTQRRGREGAGDCLANCRWPGRCLNPSTAHDRVKGSEPGGRQFFNAVHANSHS
jgi:hypothetical protein